MFHMTGVPKGETFEHHAHNWYDEAGIPEIQVEGVVYTRQSCRVVGEYLQGQCETTQWVDRDGNEAPERQIRGFGRRS